MSRAETVAIVGSGQVGTMVGSALVAAGSSAGIAAVELFDVDPGVAKASLALGGGHLVLADPESVLRADVVILAIPLGEIGTWLERFGSRLRPDQLLIDTGSAKAAVVSAMRVHVSAAVRAIGGHPMAGNEASGPGAAVPGALRGATFVLTPVRPDQSAVTRASALVTACGAEPLVLDAEMHDRQVARTSHLPHLLASALATVAAGGGRDPSLTRALAGTGYRGATRLAASDSRMVAAFLDANREQVGAALQEFRGELDRLALALASGPVSLEAALEVGRAGRALVLGAR